MIRVLLIPSSDYLGHPFPQRHNHLFERLHDGKEFEVHVIRFNIFGKPKLKTECIIHEIPFEIRTSSTPAYYLSNASSYTNEILKIIRKESIDLIVAGNLLPPFLYKLNRKLLERKLPFIFDLQDYYPVSAAGYIANPDGFLGTTLKGFLESITQTLIREADAVIVPGVALADYAKRVGAKQVYIIPNGISEHFLKKHDGSKVRRSLGYNFKDIVIGYIGSIEFWLDMEPLIKAIARARKERIPIRLLLIGKHLQTGYPKKVNIWIHKYHIENVTTWLDFIPHIKVPEYIAAMDICTIPFEVTNPTAYYAAPNKMWEYLSQGKIVISTPIPESLAHRDLLHIVRDDTDYYMVFKAYAEKRSKLGKVSSYKMQYYLRDKLWTGSVNKFKQMLYHLLKS